MYRLNTRAGVLPRSASSHFQVIDGIRMAFFISSGRASFTSLRPVNDAEEPKRDAEEVPRTKNY